MEYIFLKIGQYLSIFSPIIIFLVWKGCKVKGIEFKMMLYIVIASFCADICSLFYFEVTGKSTYWIINIYQIFDNILVFLFFRSIHKIKWISLIPIIVLSFQVLFSWYSLGVNIIWSDLISLKNVFILICSVIYLYELFGSEDQMFIENVPVFWVVIGLMLYSSGTLFLWLLSSYTIGVAKITWGLNNLLNTSKNILFAIGLWKAKSVQ